MNEYQCRVIIDRNSNKKSLPYQLSNIIKTISSEQMEDNINYRKGFKKDAARCVLL